MDIMLYTWKGRRRLRKNTKFVNLLLLLFIAADVTLLFFFRKIIFSEMYFGTDTSPEKPKVTELSSSLFNHNEIQVDKKHNDEVVQHQCGMQRSCSPGTFAFSIKSGAANVIPPKMCFNGQVILSRALRNADNGINIAVIDARKGAVLKTGIFNMWLGEVKSLVSFLKAIENNTIVLVATYDDAATKITDEARGLFADLGSKDITKLAFRDNWVFAGGKGIIGKSPFEQHIKNNRSSNKYDTWPELLEMMGCIPQKLD